MNTPNDGGPAFPAEHHNSSNGVVTHYKGMSLRDWFAGQVLEGFMASNEHPTMFDPKDDAEYCYAVADAMLAARLAPATTEGGR